MVAITVILAAVIATTVFGTAQNTQGKSELVAQTTGDMSADIPGSDDQRIKVYHESGDSIEVKNLDVIVDATDTCGKRARVTDGTVTNIDSPDYQGDDFLDDYGLKGQLGTGSNNEWTSGERLQIRINNGDCPLDPGDTVTVTVVHTPTNSILGEHDVTAE